MKYYRTTRRYIRRLYKLSQRREWCEYYPFCDHLHCQDRFWHHLNLQSLMLGLARPDGNGIAVYYREERLRMKWKVLNFQGVTAE